MHFGHINFDYAISSCEPKDEKKSNVLFLKMQLDLEIDLTGLYSEPTKC